MDEARRDYLEYLAARYTATAGTLEATEIVDLVDTFTDNGIWVDCFLDIMDSESKLLEVLSPMFAECLSEFGAEIPSWEQYLWKLICYRAKQIVVEKVSPIEGVISLKNDVMHDPVLNTNSDEYFGESYDIFNLTSAYWQWDNILERHFDYSESETADIRREIEEDIRQEAKAWLAANGDKR